MKANKPKPVQRRSYGFIKYLDLLIYFLLCKIAVSIGLSAFPSPALNKAIGKSCSTGLLLL